MLEPGHRVANRGQPQPGHGRILGQVGDLVGLAGLEAAGERHTPAFEPPLAARQFLAGGKRRGRADRQSAVRPGRIHRRIVGQVAQGDLVHAFVGRKGGPNHAADRPAVVLPGRGHLDPHLAGLDRDVEFPADLHHGEAVLGDQAAQAALAAPVGNFDPGGAVAPPGRLGFQDAEIGRERHPPRRILGCEIHVGDDPVPRVLGIDLEIEPPGDLFVARLADVGALGDFHPYDFGVGGRKCGQAQGRHQKADHRRPAVAEIHGSSRPLVAPCCSLILFASFVLFVVPGSPVVIAEREEAPRTQSGRVCEVECFPNSAERHIVFHREAHEEGEIRPIKHPYCLVGSFGSP